MTLKFKKESQKETMPQSFLRVMKTFLNFYNFSELWYSFKYSVEAFKPYHCRKLFLNEISKMHIEGTSQRCNQNSVKLLGWCFSQKWIMAENC